MFQADKDWTWLVNFCNISTPGHTQTPGTFPSFARNSNVYLINETAIA